MHNERTYARIDGVEIVQGKARYGTDMWLPNMLYGKLVRSTEAHARILRIDTKKARSLKGVAAVITAADLPDRRIRWLIDDQPILAREKVRYVGEPVAAVAAEDESVAEEAASLIEIEYERLPTITDPNEALTSEVLIHDEQSKYAAIPSINLRNVCSYSRIKRGDAELALASSDIVVEDEFEAAAVSQAHLEPHAAMASVDPEGTVTVWTSTQSPYIIRSAISWLLDLPINRVRVIATKTGGGFGAKLAPIIEPYCVALSLTTRRPVKMVFSRFEEMAAGTPQTMLRFSLKSGVSKNGAILARLVKVVMDAGAYAGDAPVDVNIALLITTGAYKVENVYAEGYAVYTNKPRCGAFRSVGAPQATFALESHMEHIADELGMDPLEFRIRNIWDDGYVTPWGQRLENVGLRETLRRVAERIGWGRIRMGRGQGIGFACGVTLTAAMHPSSVRVRINEDGSVTVFAGASEIGTGAMLGGLPLIVSKELGLPVEKIKFAPSDTELSPFSDGAQGSSTTYVAGTATLMAVKQLKKRILELAAQTLEVRPEDLQMTDGKIWVKDAPEKSVTVQDLVHYAHYKLGEELVGYSGMVTQFPDYDRDALTGFFYVPSLIEPTYTAHAVLVDVDEETGHVKLIKYVAGQDSGKVVWRAGLEGQIFGGVAQGIGFALYEELKMDQGGNIINPTFMDYVLPTAIEIPNIETVIVEDFPAKGPLGVKGAGEAPIV
ncbi:MAG: xanthine dehydrogenase family protein molybdopterin-binding subunit, partial [Nitrososphaerota archaeon]